MSNRLTYSHWTGREKTELREGYWWASEEQLLSSLNHSWQGITNQARTMNLSRNLWPLPDWTEEEKGWLEGIIDGEASLSLIFDKGPAKDRFRAVMAIYNTDLKIIGEAQRLTNGPLYTHDYQLKHPNHKVRYAIVLQHNRLRAILPRIKLVGKERQRILLLEALEIMQRRRGGNHIVHPEDGTMRLRQIVDEMKALNQRGAK